MLHHLRAHTRSLLAAAAVLASVAATAAPASAAGAPPLSHGSTYLALGDSVTFGYQEPEVVPTPNYSDAASFVGYPELVASDLHINAVNAACSGETSGSFIDTSAISNGCENTLGHPGGYRTRYPLHVSYSGSQLAFAVSYLRTHHDVRLVSLMIGANDLFVCEKTTPDHCASLDEQHATVMTIQHNVAHILRAIRREAHYHGQLAIVNYYSLNYASALDNATSALLNDAQDSAARPFGVVFADGYGEFETAARIFGGDSCAAGLLTAWGSPRTCGIHPSYAGQTLLAQSVMKVVRLGAGRR